MTGLCSGIYLAGVVRLCFTFTDLDPLGINPSTLESLSLLVFLTAFYCAAQRIKAAALLQRLESGQLRGLTVHEKETLLRLRSWERVPWWFAARDKLLVAGVVLLVAAHIWRDFDPAVALWRGPAAIRPAERSQRPQMRRRSAALPPARHRRRSR